MSRRNVVVWLLVGIAVLAIGIAIHPRLLRTAAHWLDVGERPQGANYVMVLNGGENTRPFVAAALVNAGWAPHVLVSETALTPEEIAGIVPPSHEINQQVFLKRGVPADKITILPGAAATTYDEAKALAVFLEDRPNARVLVVTNDCHTRRSRWVFSRVLGERARRVSFVSAPSDEFSTDQWWRGQLGFVAITMEYLKLAFYAAAYGCLGYWLAACGLLILVAGWIRRRKP